MNLPLLNSCRMVRTRLKAGFYFMIELSEAELQDRLVNFFGKWFDVYFEEWSLCRTSRIDLILFHSSDLSKQYPIGIEIKKGKIKRGTNIGAWCLQAKRYNSVLFFEKKAHIFTAPQISGWYLDEGRLVKKHDIDAPGYLGAHNNVNSFLYKSFSIGELQKYTATWPTRKECYRLVMNTFIIWTSETPLTFNTHYLDKL